MTEETKHLIYVIACFVVPLVAAPLVTLALRPLYAIFLREGLELFTEVQLPDHLCRAIAHVMTLANVIILIVAWLGSFGCLLLDGSATSSTLIAIAGVLVAMAVTMRMVRSRVGVVGRPVLLVGLLTFAGGNLPIFLIVPVVLLFR